MPMESHPSSIIFCPACNSKPAKKPLPDCLARLSKSNHPPSDTEFQLATAFPSNTPICRRWIPRYPKWNSRLSTLRELRRVRSEDIFSLNSITSATRLIPIEILRETFEICVNEMMADVLSDNLKMREIMLHPNPEKPTSRDPFRAPWVLSAVCTR